MARPTVQSMLAPRHLAKYLIGVRYNGLMIVKTDPGEGLMGPRNDAGDQSIVLESFSDSNWAACKGSRKSVSASVICVAGNMLFSSSRNTTSGGTFIRGSGTPFVREQHLRCSSDP